MTAAGVVAVMALVFAIGCWAGAIAERRVSSSYRAASELHKKRGDHLQAWFDDFWEERERFIRDFGYDPVPGWPR